MAAENDMAETDCVAEDAVRSDRSPSQDSLLAGNLTGKFSIFGLFPRFWRSYPLVNSGLKDRIPYEGEQGIFSSKQGILLSKQGIFRR